jgi:2-polyprenyl-3-methyl-5-hydroxy-6-metoxy-1,4-benzoquinol methylase
MIVYANQLIARTTEAISCDPEQRKRPDGQEHLGLSSSRQTLMTPTATSEKVLRYVNVHCNLCGRSTYRVKYRTASPTPAIPNQAHFQASTDRYGDFGQIVKCLSCGLIYTNPRLESADILPMYARSEDEEYTEESSSRSINAHLSLNTLMPLVPQGRLLDVGCSTGYFLNAARLHYDVQGIEPSQQAAKYAREQLKLNVRTGSLEEASLPEASFAAVTLIDVIEHLTDPMGALRQVHRLLQPNGCLYLVTPNIGSLTARLLGKRWWGLRPAHIYYFSRSTLKAMLEKAGFEVVLSRSFGRTFSGRYWVSRVRNYSGWVTRSAQWLMNRLGIANKLIYINTFDSIEMCARRKAS